MDQAVAFKATFHNIKNVMGRKVAQVICEVPIEEARHVTDILGWPDPNNPKWIAIALLNEDVE
jgi:hypothetical protein